MAPLARPTVHATLVGRRCPRVFPRGRGADLDSFAYRGGLAGQVRVFEEDHPASQEAKRSALAVAGIPAPGNVTIVPADLAAGSLVRCLAGTGFDRSAPAVFCWLGVTMYLTADAIAETITAIAGLAPGSELIADYLLPEDARDEAGGCSAGSSPRRPRNKASRGARTSPRRRSRTWPAARAWARCAPSGGVTPFPRGCGGARTRCARRSLPSSSAPR
jgi:methyltransferase (TIGR00027 family)